MILILWVPEGQAAWHEAGIVYQQAVTKILGRGDISWGTKADHYYKFGGAVVSADGSKVLFSGKCEFCDPAEVRPSLVNPDGSGLKDLSGMLPPDITNCWSAWRNMIINDDGSKVFFRATIEAGYYDDQFLYVYDVASAITRLAVEEKISSGITWLSASMKTVTGSIWINLTQAGMRRFRNVERVFFTRKPVEPNSGILMWTIFPVNPNVVTSSYSTCWVLPCKMTGLFLSRTVIMIRLMETISTQDSTTPS